MSGAEIAQLVTAIASLIAAVGTYLNGRRIKEVQKSTNGLTHRLEDIARKEGKAEGVAQEKATRGE